MKYEKRPIDLRFTTIEFVESARSKVQCNVVENRVVSLRKPALEAAGRPVMFLFLLLFRFVSDSLSVLHTRSDSPVLTIVDTTPATCSYFL